ncbi:MAG: NADH-quinone oxidoreductase subunit N [Verrucomicrobiales bacterium]|nr:NADH-quinone oxidoreductase subunit N [Verrucomicrobiales bacterium]MCP5559261.1 NADH-quinone oxidoreductase subunit N [Verrucomicrobiaceae bacterium]
MNYTLLIQAHLTELTLICTALIVLMVDRLIMVRCYPRLRDPVAAGLTVIGCGIAMCGTFQADEAIAAMTAAVAIISLGERFTQQVGEYFLLLLLAAAGLIFMVHSSDLLNAFLGLETASLTFYVLVALDRRRAEAVQAGFKYFLYGGVSAACLLYGLSLIYGLTGSLNFAHCTKAFATMPPSQMAYVAAIMLVVGFAFKLAAAPFHLWAPDVYRHAATPVAAFIASASKVGGIYLLARVAGAFQREAMLPALVVVTVLSLVIGNLAAISQTSLSRLLAFSAVAHAGYVLVGLCIAPSQPVPIAAMVYYAVTYAIATVGAFGVVLALRRDAGSDCMSGLDGLNQRSPALAILLAVFVLSLAGIPPLAGFFGKFYVFASALRGGSSMTIGVAAFAILMSAVSLYYYLQVLKRVFVQPLKDDNQPPLQVSRVTMILLTLLALAAILAGLFPQGLLQSLAPQL